MQLCGNKVAQLRSELSTPECWGGIEFALGLGGANYYLGRNFSLIDFGQNPLAQGEYIHLQRSFGIRQVLIDQGKQA